MGQRAAAFTVEEHGGDKFASLAVAQRAAHAQLAAELVTIIRQLKAAATAESGDAAGSIAQTSEQGLQEEQETE